MKRIRTLALLLALITCLSFVACAKQPSAQDDPADDNTPTDGTPADTPSADNPQTAPEDQVPSVTEQEPLDRAADDNLAAAKEKLGYTDYEGMPLRILVSTSTSAFNAGDGNLSRNVVASKKTGDTVNDAVLLRNEELQKTLGVSLVVTERPSSKVGDELYSSILAQRDRYDLCFSKMDSLRGPFLNGLLVDLNKTDIDFTAPWWDQNAVSSLTVDSRLYLAAGDCDILDKQATMVCLLNKTLAKEQGIDINSIYKMVENGAWTIDKLLDLAKTVKSSDLYGILTEYSSATGFYCGFGGRITDTVGGQLDVVIDHSNMASPLDKALEVFKDNSVSKVEDMNSDWARASNLFANNQVLFRITNLGVAERWRGRDVDFAVLPMPKLSRSQPDYMHHVKQSATVVCIPNTETDVFFAADCLEAFTALSRYTLREAYMDTIKECMLSPDAKTDRMLDLIFDTRTWDVATFVPLGNRTSAFDRTLSDSVNSAAQGTFSEGSIYGFADLVRSTQLPTLFQFPPV